MNSIMKVKNGASLFFLLMSGKLKPGKLWFSKRYRIKFFLRALLNPRLSVRLFNSIANDTMCMDILSRQPRLPCRLHHPYLSSNFKKNDAVLFINEHYKLINLLLSTDVNKNIFHDDVFFIGTIIGKSGKIYRVSLSPIDSLNKEGELSVSFLTEDNIQLAVSTFSLLNFHGKRTLFIGGLQGAEPSISHDFIHKATKECYGLFPKRIVIEMICLFARLCNCQDILAVGNNTHIYKNWRYARKKSKKMFSDYDEFWRSIGAKDTVEGYFNLPLCINRKSIDEVVSKKRSEYRNRYKLLDELNRSALITLSTK